MTASEPRSRERAVTAGGPARSRGRGLSALLPPPRRQAAGPQGRAWPWRPRVAAAPPAGRGGKSRRKEPDPGCHRVAAGAAAAAASRAPSPRATPSSPPATSQRPPEPPRGSHTPEAAGPGPPRPSARPPRSAPAFTLERPGQPQQGRRRRIEELSRSSRERLLQSRDRMFSKFTSILQHAVEAVRPRAAGARPAGAGGGLRSPPARREPPASAGPSAAPAPRRGEAPGGGCGVVGASGLALSRPPLVLPALGRRGPVPSFKRMRGDRPSRPGSMVARFL